MSEKEGRQKIWRLLPLLALWVAVLVTAGVAFAGAPTNNVAGPPTQKQVQPGKGQALQQANVRVVQLPKGVTSRGVNRQVRAGNAIAGAKIYEFSANPAPQAEVEEKAKAEARDRSQAGPSSPANIAVGSDNATLTAAPDVARPGNLVVTVATGFRPFEIVVYSISGFSPNYFQVDEDGALFVTITTGNPGYFNVSARGLYSGKVAGAVYQVSATAPSEPAVAVAPHAARPGDRLFMFAVGYTPGVTITFERASTPFFEFAADSTGRALIFTTVGAGSDGSAVYSTFVTNTVGTKAGQSIEERADAGPPDSPKGDNNVTRAFVDRAILSTTITTTVALVGEGFNAGESVALTFLPSTPLATATADANGSVSFFLQSPPNKNPTDYFFSLTGATSGGLAYASLRQVPIATNVPSSIVQPSRTDGVGNVTLLFTKFLPNQGGAVFVDGSAVGGSSTNAEGFGAVVLPKPVGGPIVHNLAFANNPGESAPAPLLLVARPSGLVTGTITDAVSGRPIKGTVRVAGQPDTLVQSDPTRGGSYQLPLQAGNYQLEVRGSGCYFPQTVQVTVSPTGTVTQSFPLARSASDAGGYSCEENVGRSFTPAANAVFTPTFDDAIVDIDLPFPVTYYGTTVTTGTISTNGFVTLGFQPPSVFGYASNGTIPSTTDPDGTVAVIWDDLGGSGGDSNVYTSVTGVSPNRTFIVEWRNYVFFGDIITNTAQVQIEESTGDIYMVYPTFNVGIGDGRSASIGIENPGPPAVGTGPGTIGKAYQLNFGIGANLEPNNYLWAGNSVRYTRGGVSTATPTGSPSNTPTSTRAPTNTRTPTATPAACGTLSNYTVISTTGTIVPGTFDIGNHTDTGVTFITLPFAYDLYDETFTNANISSNGNVQFTSNSNSSFNVCLPSAVQNDSILAFWDDLATSDLGALTGRGVFTSVTGTAPSRIFNIEFRTRRIGNTNGPFDFEVRLYEGQRRFDVIYGTIQTAGTGANGNSATSGVQRNTSSTGGGLFTQYSCDTGNLTSGLMLTFNQPDCATSTPGVPSNTTTSTPTNTFVPVAGASNTAVVIGTASSTVGVIVGTNTATASATAQPPIQALLYGLTTNNRLISFNSDAPGTLLSNVQITGVMTGEQVLGIDFRPANGMLYGLGSTSRLYTINPMTGAATQAGAVLSPTLQGFEFGFDFNPVVDRIRIVSDQRQNLRVHPDTGAVTVDGTLTYSTTDPFSTTIPNVAGAAYTDNFSSTASTTLYDIDTNGGRLVIQNPPNAGTLNTVGNLGVLASSQLGFDIVGPSNTAFAALINQLSRPTGGSSALYTINLGTGAASLIGTIGGGLQVRGLAAVPVAGPGTPTVVASSTTTVTPIVTAGTGTATSTVVVGTATPCPPGSIFQELEPNNVITQANSISDKRMSEIRGGINPINDVDFYSFQANAGDRVWAYLVTNNAPTGTGNSQDSQLTFLDIMSNTIQFDDDGGSQTSLSSGIAGAPVLSNGTYLLKANEYLGGQLLDPYRLYVDRTSSAPIAEVEPNDVITQANTYTMGSVVTGSIPITTDLDVFTFTLALNDKIVIQVDGDPERDGVEFNPNFDLLDASGTVIAAVDSDSTFGGGLRSESFVYTSTVAASFAVRVKFDPSTPTTDDTGTYNLHIFRVGTNPCFSTATATTTNTATGTATRTTVVTGTPPTATATVCVPGGGTPGPWRTSTPLPPARYRGGGTSDGQNVYIFGGGLGTARLNDLWRWSAATETWTQLANMPTGKQNHQGVFHNGKIYVPGGFLATTHTTENAIYDVATNTWSQGAPIPLAHTGTTAAFNGKIYLFGGNPATTRTDIYDIASNTWTQGPNMPVGITYGRAVTAGNFIYYVGGITTTSVNTLYRFDPATNTFMTMAPMITARSGQEVMSDGTSIFAVNGATGTAYFVGLPQAQTVEIYNIATNTWTQGNPTTQTSSSPAGGLAGGKLMIQGGINSPSPELNVVQVSQLTGGSGGCPSGTPATATRTSTMIVGSPTATVCVPSAGMWTPVATAPAPARYFADGAGGSDGKFYMVGGLNAANAALANFESFDGATNAWTALAPVPTARGLSAIGSLGGKVFVAGGGIIAGTSFQAINDTRVFDIATNTWTAGAVLPVALAATSNAAVPATNRFYLFGGFDGAGADNLTTYIYNPTTNTWTTGANLPGAKTLAAAAEFGGKVYLYGGFGTTNSPADVVSGKAQGIEANTTLLVYDPVANTFTPLAPGPSPRARHAMSARDGQLFVTGGNTDNSFNPTADVFVYNIATNSWSTGPSLSTGRTEHAQGILGDGRIIAATGLTPPGTTRSQSAEALPRGQVCPTPGTSTPGTAVTSTATRTSTPPVGGTATSTPCVAGGAGTWTDVTAIPVAKGRHLGVTLGTNVYLFGGRGDNVTYDRNVFRFDTAAQTYTLVAGATIPFTNTSNLGGGVLTFPEGQRIFLLSGSGPASAVDGLTAAYDPVANTFTNKATWPAAPARIPGGWAVANNKFYVFGGFIPSPFAIQADIWMYDPMTNAWTELPIDLGEARGYIAVETMPDGMIYIAGGSPDVGGTLGNSTRFEKFNPATGTLTQGPNMLLAKSNNQGYNSNGLFIVPTGGFPVVDELNEMVQIYNPATNTWSMGPPALHAVRNYAKGYGANGVIYVIGGLDVDGAFTQFTQRFTPGVSGPCPSVTAVTTPAVTNTATSTAIVVPSATRTTAPTSVTTVAPSSTATQVATGTVVVTSTAVVTSTVARTSTVVPTGTSAPPTACPFQFTDVPPTNTFYTFVRCLACRGIIGGYNDGTFRPNNQVTRGQLSKIVSNSAGFNDPAGAQIYEDVPANQTFYEWVNRLSRRGIMGGYPCGLINTEPCGANNLPYFRPQANATRGQISKIVSNAAGFSEPQTGQTFADVPDDNPFHLWIERLATRGIMGGYPCNSVPSEPCDALNRPYFRWANDSTRGQTAKIVAGAFFPNCQTPLRPVNPSDARADD